MAVADEKRENERLAAAVAAHLAGATSEVAAQLAILTAQTNTEIKVSLATICGEIKQINDRLGNYVPQACIEHNRDLIMLVKRIADVEDFKERLNGEHEALKTTVDANGKKITGLYALCGGLTATVLGAIVVAVIRHFV